MADRVVASGSFNVFAGLIDHLGIPYLKDPPRDVFTLFEGPEGIELCPPDEADRPGIRAIFPPDAKRSSDWPRTPLAKAFGKRITTVVDLTAGLGGDAYRLAAVGYEVHAWERHPAVFALLASGWGVCVERGQVSSEIIDRLSFHWGDGSAALGETCPGSQGAYFDPMYPSNKRRSALPKRPLQVLRQLLETDEDPVELVTAAREELARVVVKRPRSAASIVPGASFAVETKLVRFDVYVNPARMEPSES